MYVVTDANTGQVLSWNHGSLSDALDECELIDPDESRGVYARKAIAEEMSWADAA